MPFLWGNRRFLLNFQPYVLAPLQHYTFDSYRHQLCHWGVQNLCLGCGRIWDWFLAANAGETTRTLLHITHPSTLPNLLTYTKPVSEIIPEADTWRTPEYQTAWGTGTWTSHTPLKSHKHSVITITFHNSLYVAQHETRSWFS
jgi:hypothetical protein